MALPTSRPSASGRPIEPGRAGDAATSARRSAASPSASGETGTVVRLPRPEQASSITHHLELVDQQLSEVLADLHHLWSTKLAPAGESADVLGEDDLPALLDTLVHSGGKRIRPVMAHLGWVSASGQARGIGHADVVRVSAALDLLHAFALVHDDVMDESTSRRGVATAHLHAAELHRRTGGQGRAERFGDNIAILLGDLAHAEADALVAGLPEELRRIWRLLVIELVYGQRRDLTGSAAGRRDLTHARQVARLKSGAYTVERPLQLGAAAARAPEVVSAALATYGQEVGEAFALRDDLLGVWGDPSRTGKPAGDDLISAKPTVILALAHERTTGAARAMLSKVGTPDLTVDDITQLQESLQECGVVAEVEDRINRHVAEALAALDSSALDPDGVRELTVMAHKIAWRDA
ncbi:polyprenyl synthetase family protein [Microlunatus aurantiacus]|uniref:Polyprenyl synthetase family protein n=1 Tax=Microlunatus aurantiacus TaxID=446786 RepID=A0ABP7DKN2_9ACTN